MSAPSAPIDYAAVAFESANAMVASVQSTTSGIAGSLAGAIVGSNILPLMFGIQLSIAAVYFVLEWDGFRLMTTVIKLVILYAILLYVLTSWPTIGMDLVNMISSWLVGAVGGAAGVAGGNPVEAMAGIMQDFRQGTEPLFEKIQRLQQNAQEAQRAAQVVAEAAAEADRSRRAGQALETSPETPAGP